MRTQQDLQQQVMYAALFAEVRVTMRRYPKDTPLTLEGLQTIIVRAAERQQRFEERRFLRAERQHRQLMSQISFFGQD